MRFYQVIERLCNHQTGSCWRCVKQTVQEHTGLDDLKTMFAVVGNRQMFGVVDHDHHFVQCGVIFFIESVDHDQGGDQVAVVVMYLSGNTRHDRFVATHSRCPLLAAS